MLSWALLPHFTSFDDYVAAFPEGEGFRNWLTRSGVALIVKGTGLHDPLPGGFLWASVHNRDGATVVVVQDDDDGAWEYKTNNPAGELDNLKELAPLSPILLGFVGYKG